MSSKNRTKRKRNKRKQRARIPRKLILGGFPPSQVVKLRYVDSNLTLDPGAAGSVFHTFRLNSVFDPDYTAVGHQPMAFDEWTAMYSHYTVMSSRISVMAKPSGSGNIIPAAFGVLVAAETSPLSTFSSIDNILESRLNDGWRVTSTSQPSGGGVTTYPTIVKNFNAKRFFGLKDVEDGVGYGAAYDANPTQQAYATVWAASLDGGNAGEFTAVVTIDYTVEFSKPITINGS